MNKHDMIPRLDRLLDGLEAEILAASDADVLGARADTGRVRTAVLHAARAVIAGEADPNGDQAALEDVAIQRLAIDGIDVIPGQRGEASVSGWAPWRKTR